MSDDKGTNHHDNGDNMSLKPVVKTRSRRTSSVGNINLGDTISSISTMKLTKEQKLASKERLKELNRNIDNNDKDLARKIWLSYLEINYRRVWLTPLLILLIVYFAYYTSGNKTESNPLYQFINISYQVGDTDQYGKGIKDLSFVAFHMVFFTFLREFLMDAIIKPITINKLKITKTHKVKRIMEQVYSIIYYGTSGPFGIYIMYHSDLWLFKTETMYATYPNFYNSYLYKFFYLGQASFWAQQACVLVLQLEKPRKDYNELIFHHVVTLLLIWSSYVFHFTRMGLAIYITMDVSDLFLSLSKLSNYLELGCTPVIFFIFIAVWVYLRHIVNIKILWSVLTEFRTVGSYTLNFATSQYKCWISLPIVFTLIAALQLVNLYWLFLIFRILYRLIWLDIQKDERSESSSEDEDTPSSEFHSESKEDI
ncbi:hypothetical protein TPHA_0C04030 [Tetrapisispora phaffii CBS 4417]|uniref:TLC domain-containing protein n=1 Tax=Tetrapisispora phaffii (strain ATCC 24235 / CBS 4417 / NBRC 1672 / NRRL Y-8282 / UCD 70-5) TaxID=1071381 RepID=G8BQP1_TETPH|nr:hypothetical protein TPHA_0C04030 [Tetrapisispora phaffii CBS 4417]CCE62553.1 hypothetical protein TPHA_0C04030 [Tetrapisispora phaffii CBS 4417]